MVGGVEVSGLVKPGCTVVVFPRARERDEYRGLFLTVPLPAEAADRRLRYDRHRIDASSVWGICVRLRIQIVLAARGCSADLPVRYLAVERHSRTIRSDRGRGLLRCAVAILLHQLGTMTGAQTAVTTAWVIVPLIVIAECFSW